MYFLRLYGRSNINCKQSTNLAMKRRNENAQNITDNFLVTKYEPG
jgi:hypothetical protein